MHCRTLFIRQSNIQGTKKGKAVIQSVSPASFEISENKPSALKVEGLFMTIHNDFTNDDFHSKKKENLRGALEIKIGFWEISPYFSFQ